MAVSPGDLAQDRDELHMCGPEKFTPPVLLQSSDIKTLTGSLQSRLTFVQIEVVIMLCSGNCI
jgi:hypothetical protein